MCAAPFSETWRQFVHFFHIFLCKTRKRGALNHILFMPNCARKATSMPKIAHARNPSPKSGSHFYYIAVQNSAEPFGIAEFIWIWIKLRWALAVRNQTKNLTPTIWNSGNVKILPVFHVNWRFKCNFEIKSITTTKNGNSKTLSK